MLGAKTKPGATLVESGSISEREKRIAHIEHELEVLRDRKQILQHEVLLMGGKITILERMSHILWRFR